MLHFRNSCPVLFTNNNNNENVNEWDGFVIKAKQITKQIKGAPDKRVMFHIYMKNNVQDYKFLWTTRNDSLPRTELNNPATITRESRVSLCQLPISDTRQGQSSMFKFALRLKMCNLIGFLVLSILWTPVSSQNTQNINVRKFNDIS